MVPIPDPETQADLVAKLDDFAKAIESHKDWTPPKPHPALFHTWDFIKRSHYIMTEIENIRQGNELKYPDQIPKNEGAKDNEEKARMSFTDVVTRTVTINMIIQDPTKLAQLGLPSIDFGEDIISKGDIVSQALFAIPEDPNEVSEDP